MAGGRREKGWDTALDIAWALIINKKVRKYAISSKVMFVSPYLTITLLVSYSTEMILHASSTLVINEQE